MVLHPVAQAAPLILLAFAIPATANSAEYYGNADCHTGGNPAAPDHDCVNIACLAWQVAGTCALTTDICPEVSLGLFGYVCFPRGHIVPDDTGGASVSVADDTFSPIAGFVCQDLDFDAVCGEAGELGIAFCGSTPFFEPTWIASEPLFVYVGGVGQTLHHCQSVGEGTHGFVAHA